MKLPSLSGPIKVRKVKPTPQRRVKLTRYEQRVKRKLEQRVPITRPDVDGVTKHKPVIYTSHDVTRHDKHEVPVTQTESGYLTRDNTRNCTVTKDSSKMLHPAKTFKRGSRDGEYGPGETRPAVYAKQLKVNQL